MAALITGSTAASAGGLEPPPPVDNAAIEGFLATNSSAPVVLLQQWVGYDVRFRARSEGLVGTLTSLREFVVQSRAGVEESSLVIADYPRVRFKRLDVEVTNSGSTQRYRHKDLRWIEITQRSDGVVTLDGTMSYSFVPGIRVGSRVRVLEVAELKGVHGFGQSRLGSRYIPTLAASVSVRVPEDYRLHWQTEGDPVHHEPGDRIHHWTLGPGSASRDCLPSATLALHIADAGGDHAPSLAVGESWAEVGAAYLDRIAPVFHLDEESVRQANTLVAGLEDPHEVIDRLYRDVQDRCRYLGLFEGLGGIIPEPAGEVQASGFGDCKGLGTLLIAQLRAVGIAAHPVLLRTRSAGPLLTEVPDMAQFNHYIVWADTGGEGLYLDGTVDHCPAGVVPHQDTASKVLVLEPGNIRLAEIPDRTWRPGPAVQTLAGTIDADGALSVAIERQVDGSTAMTLRNLVDAGSRDREQLVRHQLLTRTLHPVTLELHGAGEWRSPLRLRAEARTPGALATHDGQVFLPKLLSPVSMDLDADPCDGPLDLRPRPSHREDWAIELPDGLTLAAPDSIRLEAPGVRWVRRAWQDGTVLRLRREVEWTGEWLEPGGFEAARDVLKSGQRTESGFFILRTQD